MEERTTQERLEKLILHRDSVIEQANLKGADIPLNSSFPEIIAGIARITIGLDAVAVETLLDSILGEVVTGDYTVKGQAIEDAKEAIRQAIVAKEVDVSEDTPLSEYSTKIDEIQQGAGEGKIHIVKFVLPDGHVFSTQEVVDGGAATNPGIPYEIPYTTFTEWLGDYSNINKYTVIFARYEPVSSDIIFSISIRTASQVLKILKRNTNVVSVDWGDGTQEEVTTLQHTYAVVGDYIVRMTGTNLEFGSNSSSRSMFDTTTATHILNWAILGSSLFRLKFAMFVNCVGIKYVIFPRLAGNDYLQDTVSLFSYCYGLTCIVFPESATYMSPNGGMFNNSTVKYIYLPRTINQFYLSSNILSATKAEYVDYGSQSNLIPGLLSGCANLEFESFERTGPAFGNYSLSTVKIKNIVWNEANRIIGKNTLRLMQRVVEVPSYIETIDEYAFHQSEFERCILSDSTAVHPLALATCSKLLRIKFKNLSSNTIPSQFLNACASLEVVDFPSTVTSFSGTASYNDGRGCLRAFICRAIVPPTAAAGLFDYNLGAPDFYVPDESVDAYKAATNWSSVAYRIYPLSDCPERYLNDDL